jgi:hypothetical protein
MTKGHNNSNTEGKWLKIESFRSLNSSDEIHLLECLNAAAKEKELPSEDNVFVLYCTFEEEDCRIWFHNKYCCSYGLNLNGTLFEGQALTIKRCVTTKAYLLFLQLHGQQVDYKVEDRRYRMVEMQTDGNRGTTELQLFDSLNMIMQEYGVGSFIYPPVMCVCKLDCSTFQAEMRTVKDALNALNFDFFPCNGEVIYLNCQIPEDQIKFYSMSNIHKSEVQKRFNGFPFRAGKPSNVLVTTCGEDDALELVDFIDKYAGVCSRYTPSNADMCWGNFKYYRVFVEMETIVDAGRIMLEMSSYINENKDGAVDHKVEFFFCPFLDYHLNWWAEVPSEVVLRRWDCKSGYEGGACFVKDLGLTCKKKK